MIAEWRQCTDYVLIVRAAQLVYWNKKWKRRRKAYSYVWWAIERVRVHYHWRSISLQAEGRRGINDESHSGPDGCFWEFFLSSVVVSPLKKKKGSTVRPFVRRIILMLTLFFCLFCFPFTHAVGFLLAVSFCFALATDIIRLELVFYRCCKWPSQEHCGCRCFPLTPTPTQQWFQNLWVNYI